MDYTLKIDHNNKLIRYKHNGDISKADIGMAWQELLQMEEFTQKKYDLLTDYTDVRFIMKDTEVTEITMFLSTLKPILKGKKQALVLSEPMSTALSMLFAGEVVKEVGFIVEVFSTIKGAISWIKTS